MEMQPKFLKASIQTSLKKKTVDFGSDSLLSQTHCQVDKFMSRL